MEWRTRSRHRNAACRSLLALILAGPTTLAAQTTADSGSFVVRHASDIGDVRFHLKVDREGRVLGGRIPAQNVVVERQ